MPRGHTKRCFGVFTPIISKIRQEIESLGVLRTPDFVIWTPGFLSVRQKLRGLGVLNVQLNCHAKDDVIIPKTEIQMLVF